MSNKLKGWLIGIGVIIVLSIPIIIDTVKNSQMSEIAYNDYINLISNGEFALIYFGDTSAEDYTEIKSTLVSLKKEFKVTVDTVNYTKISDANLEELQSTFTSEKAYVVISDGLVVKVIEGDTTLNNLKTIINKYYNNIIPEDEIKYTSISNAKDHISIINSKKVTMTVFGNDGCSWCKKFRVVYNDVLEENDNIDIYYANSSVMNSNEWSELLKADLMIPAKCTSDGTEDLPLSNGFGTPLTLFTKNGKVIDCISGFVRKPSLVSKLKEVSLIK